MKLKHDYRKVGYFVVIFLIGIELIMLVGTLATESDKISSESLFVSIIFFVICSNKFIVECHTARYEYQR